MGSLVGVSVIMARKHFDSEGMSLMQGRAIASDPMQSVPTWMEAAVALALLGPAKHYESILDRVRTSVFQQGRKERYLLILLL